MEKARISGIIKESIVDGPGIRFVVFAQGCKHLCKGCHNPQTFDLLGGYEICLKDLILELKKESLVTGITLSGGEPFLQPKFFYFFAKQAKALGLDVISYSGYTFEELLEKKEEYILKLLSQIDILIDGKFILEKRNLLLEFRGSENQRIIDVKKSLKNNCVVETSFDIMYN